MSSKISLDEALRNYTAVENGNWDYDRGFRIKRKPQVEIPKASTLERWLKKKKRQIGKVWGDLSGVPKQQYFIDEAVKQSLGNNK